MIKYLIGLNFILLFMILECDFIYLEAQAWNENLSYKICESRILMRDEILFAQVKIY